MPSPRDDLMGGGSDDESDDASGGGGGKKKEKKGRRKIKIEFIDDKSRRHITFSKRKAGIMKKAFELATLTGTQVLLLVASETGHVYTFATPKLQPLITKPEGKNLIQQCLNSNEVPSQPVQAPQANARMNYSEGGGHGSNNSNLPEADYTPEEEKKTRHVPARVKAEPKREAASSSSSSSSASAAAALIEQQQVAAAQQQQREQQQREQQQREQQQREQQHLAHHMHHPQAAAAAAQMHAASQAGQSTQAAISAAAAAAAQAHHQGIPPGMYMPPYFPGAPGMPGLPGRGAMAAPYGYPQFPQFSAPPGGYSHAAMFPPGAGPVPGGPKPGQQQQAQQQQFSVAHMGLPHGFPLGMDSLLSSGMPLAEQEGELGHPPMPAHLAGGHADAHPAQSDGHH